MIYINSFVHVYSKLNVRTWSAFFDSILRLSVPIFMHLKSDLRFLPGRVKHKGATIDTHIEAKKSYKRSAWLEYVELIAVHSTDSAVCHSTSSTFQSPYFHLCGMLSSHAFLQSTTARNHRPSLAHTPDQRTTSRLWEFGVVWLNEKHILLPLAGCQLP